MGEIDPVWGAYFSDGWVQPPTHQPSIYNHPIGSIYHLYTTYSILPSGGLYATYHLLGEPETTIEISLSPKKTFPKPKRGSQPSDKTQVQRLSLAMRLGSERKKISDLVSHWAGKVIPKTWNWRIFGGLFWLEKNYILCSFILWLQCRNVETSENFYIFFLQWVGVCFSIALCETYQE